MPIYLFWGEDDFAMNQVIEDLRTQVLDPQWSQFNYQKINAESVDGVIVGLNQAMTPPFGFGERLVWLADTTIFNNCSESLLAELKRTLPVIPSNSHLLLTSTKKPDGRSKVTKLCQKHAEIREFALIPPWKTDALITRVNQLASQIGVRLSRNATTVLAEAVGNNTRQLWGELEKLQVYAQTSDKPLESEVVSRLVVANTQNSFQLASAIRQGNEALALKLVVELINRNEPALRIVATLVGQFRTWTQVKLMVENGERDEKVIASAAEVGNPKRIYFLRQEVKSLHSSQLLATFPLLLELEVALKQGAQPLAILQTQVVKLCQVCR